MMDITHDKTVVSPFSCQSYTLWLSIVPSEVTPFRHRDSVRTPWPPDDSRHVLCQIPLCNILYLSLITYYYISAKVEIAGHEFEIESWSDMVFLVEIPNSLLLA